MGIIIRNMNANLAFNNTRIRSQYELDQFDDHLYYAVPHVNANLFSDIGSEYSLVPHENITDYSNGYSPVWYDYANGINLVRVTSNSSNNTNVYWAGGFNRSTTSNQHSAFTSIGLDSNVSNTNPVILDIHFHRPVNITHLHLRNRAHHSTTTAAWRDYKLFGSNDKNNWTELFEVVNRSNSMGHSTLDELDVSRKYKYYRFIITNTHSHSDSGSRVTIMSQVNLLTPQEIL